MATHWAWMRNDGFPTWDPFVLGGVTFHCDPAWAAGRTAVLAELQSDIPR